MIVYNFESDTCNIKGLISRPNYRYNTVRLCNLVMLRHEYSLKHFETFKKTNPAVITVKYQKICVLLIYSVEIYISICRNLYKCTRVRIAILSSYLSFIDVFHSVMYI